MIRYLKSLYHRHGALVAICATALIVSTITRLVLLVIHWGEIQIHSSIPLVFLAGFCFDLLACAVIAILPALVSTFISSAAMSRRWFGYIVTVISSLAVFGMLYLAVTEYFFFEEFTARFNYVAVDYLIFHHEVFVNIRDTYPINTIIAICSIVTIAIMLSLAPRIRKRLRVRTNGRRRQYF